MIYHAIESEFFQFLLSLFSLSYFFLLHRNNFTKQWLWLVRSCLIGFLITVTHGFQHEVWWRRPFPKENRLVVSGMRRTMSWHYLILQDMHWSLTTKYIINAENCGLRFVVGQEAVDLCMVHSQETCITFNYALKLSIFLTCNHNCY